LGQYGQKWCFFANKIIGFLICQMKGGQALLESNLRALIWYINNNADGLIRPPFYSLLVCFMAKKLISIVDF
jgi:hypothetical protein